MDDLEFATGSSVGNDSVYASPRGWAWAKNGGGISAVYDQKGYPKQHEFFFALGWQVKTPPRMSSVTSTGDWRVAHAEGWAQGSRKASPRYA